MKKRLRLSPCRQRKNEKGFSLVIVLVLMLLGALILSPLLAYMGTGFKTGTVYQKRTDELYAADAGVKEAIWSLKVGRFPDSSALPAAGQELAVPLFTGYDTNNKTQNVKIFTQSLTNHGGVYKITSSGNSGSSSNTTIEAWVDTIPFLWDYAATSTDKITSPSGGEIHGPVSGDVSDFNGDIYGRQDPSWEPYTWPFDQTFYNFYTPLALANGTITDNVTVDLPSPKHVPGGVAYGDFEIKGGSSPNAVLDGTIWVQGDQSTFTMGKAGSYTLDLNNHAIYVSSTLSNPKVAVDIGSQVTLTGSGIIIAEGDINFQPTMATTSSDFIFVMSVGGKVNFHPNGNFYGSVAGKLEINLQPGSVLTRTEPPNDLAFPTPDGGVGSLVRIHSWKVIPPMQLSGIPLYVGTAFLPDAVIGVPYNTPLYAGSGKTPYTWAVSGLPGGLNMVGNTIIGTPAIGTAGAHTVHVQVSDSASPPATATADLTLDVINAFRIITSSPLPMGYVGEGYVAQIIEAVGGNGAYVWDPSPAGLPAGLTINSINATAAAITGTPTTAGPYIFTATVTDSTSNTAVKNFAINIAKKFTPSQDSYLSDKTKTTNYGAAATILLGKNAGGEQDDRVLVQFDLSSLTGKTIDSATLRLYATSSSGTDNITVHRISNSWTEAGVTWNKRDGSIDWSPAGGNFTAAETASSLIPVTSWNVKADVALFAAGTNNFGWIIKDKTPNGGNVVFSSKEAATNKPVLIVVYH